MISSSLFEEAAKFALRAHSGMIRKKERVPYILHPMEVAAIAATMSADEALLAAALLHDTVEDTDTSSDEIEDRFGKRVAELVASETEDKHRGRPASETWLLRKQESISVLVSSGDIEIEKLWLSDKLSNMRSFYRLYQTQGSSLWKNFHQTDPAMQAWYYRTIRDVVRDDLKDYEAWKEFSFLIDKVFEGVEEVKDGIFTV